MERDAFVQLCADGAEATTAAHDALLNGGAYVVCGTGRPLLNRSPRSRGIDFGTPDRPGVAGPGAGSTATPPARRTRSPWPRRYGPAVLAGYVGLRRPVNGCTT